ncbi:MAG: radical SAM protein [Geobacteraceae bacterium]|nr:radical SAM protein [Geobacteraceae bacterium]
MKTPIVPFFISHRGCPHRCVFCDQQKISGAEGTIPSADRILGTIHAYRRTSGRPAVEVAFFGGSFTSLPHATQESLLSPLQPLLASGEVCSVRLSTRPDSIDCDRVCFLRHMGVKTVEIGIQSMDDGVLSMAGRGHDSAAVERAFACLREQGMSVGAQLMPGLPGDTVEKSLDSLSRVLEMGPEFIRIYPALVIAGTGLAQLHADGMYQPLTLSAAISLCKVMLHRSLLRGIPVIRIGLQPTADLQRTGTILAGPWHPAFRQLVESELFYDLASRLLGGQVPGGLSATIVCNPSRVSDVVGQGRANMARLLREKGVRIEGVRTDPAFSSHEVAVILPGGARRGDLFNNIKYSSKDACND